MPPTVAQPRERAVPCRYCQRDTWNVTGICDGCEAKHTEPETFTPTELRVIVRALELSETVQSACGGCTSRYRDRFGVSLLRQRVQAMLRQAGEQA